MRLAHRLWRCLPHGFRRSLFETVTLFTSSRAGAVPGGLTADGPIIVAGVLRAPTGLGEAARGTIRALQALGRDVRIIDLTDPFRQESVVEAPTLPGPEAGPGVLIVFANPPMSSYALRFIPPHLLAGKLRVASWVWEYARVPARWARHANRYHVLATPTSLVHDAVLATTGIEPQPLPYHVAPLASGTVAETAPHGLRIGFIGDLVAAAGRKNPEAVVEAVGRAFSGRTDIELRMILRGARADHPVIQTLEARAASHGIALSIDATVLDTPGHWARLRSLDAFCSLHRCEGFGLNIAEAMAAGIPTVATRCPAVADYLDDSVGYPVRWSPVRAAPLIDDPAPGVWAEPDLDAAAQALRAIAADPDTAATRSAAAIGRIDALYSAKAVGAALDALIARAVSRP